MYIEIHTYIHIYIYTYVCIGIVVYTYIYIILYIWGRAAERANGRAGQLWAAVFERYTFFREHVFFSCFRPNPYTRMCVSIIG